MDRYVYGSAAHKIEDDISILTDAARKRDAERKAKEERYLAARRMVIRNFVLFGLAFFFLAAGTVYSRMLVDQASVAVVAKQEELMKLIEANNNKRIVREQSIDLEKIEELAITKYGMQRPDNNQTVYVNVVQNDYGEIVRK